MVDYDALEHAPANLTDAELYRADWLLAWCERWEAIERGRLDPRGPCGQMMRIHDGADERRCGRYVRIRFAKWEGETLDERRAILRHFDRRDAEYRYFLIETAAAQADAARGLDQ